MKRAVCIGINNYPQRDARLKGCVNDARSWAALLADHYDFARGDVRLVLDKAATKKGSLAAIDTLLAGAKRGDVLVVVNASHGTYLADTSGDEPRYDEAICPYDMADNLIIDDELRERFHNLPTGVRVTMVSDSCFSGSVTRDPGLPTPDKRRRRFVRPAMLGLRELDDREMHRAVPNEGRFPQSTMKEVLVSGCNDHQSSFDAQIDGTYHGAMSYFCQELIRAANYHITYGAIRKALPARLEAEGYDQQPQVEGKAANLRRVIFT